MIQKLTDIPDSMVGFRAAGEVTQQDSVKELVERTGKLNYMLILDTPVKNFTLGAWWQDALLGVKNLSKWNRAAIVTDSLAISTFTDLFSKVMPGEFKGYAFNEIKNAIDWVSGG